MHVGQCASIEGETHVINGRGHRLTTGRSFRIGGKSTHPKITSIFRRLVVVKCVCAARWATEELRRQMRGCATPWSEETRHGNESRMRNGTPRHRQCAKDFRGAGREACAAFSKTQTCQITTFTPRTPEYADTSKWAKTGI